MIILFIAMAIGMAVSAVVVFAVLISYAKKNDFIAFRVVTEDELVVGKEYLCNMSGMYWDVLKWTEDGFDCGHHEIHKILAI